MAIIGGGPMRPLREPAQGDTTYAEFERRRGGLLYVAQAVIGTAMFAVFGLSNMAQATKIGLMLALYCLYFLVRWPLWKYLYRARGHVESTIGLRLSSYQLWIGLGLAVVLPAGFVLRGVPLPLVPAIALLGGMWVVLAAVGRLPVDGGIVAIAFSFVLPTMTPAIEAAARNPKVWWVVALSFTALGLRQHFSFVSSRSDHEGT